MSPPRPDSTKAYGFNISEPDGSWTSEALETDGLLPTGPVWGRRRVVHEAGCPNDSEEEGCTRSFTVENQLWIFFFACKLQLVKKLV